MARRPPLQALHLVEVDQLPADGVVVRRNGRSYAGELPASLAGIESKRDVFVVPKEQMLTPREAGELIGLSVSRVKQLLDARALPYQSVGRDRRIPATEVIAYKEARLRRTEAAAEGGGFVSRTELEGSEPTLNEILEDVE